jgi:anti-anti-sigma factor
MTGHDSTGRGALRLLISGEHDRTNNDLLDAALRQAIADGYSAVLLDFSEGSFIDVSVVRVLLRCSTFAAEHGCMLRVVNPGASVGRVLDATATRTLLCPALSDVPRTPSEPADRHLVGRPHRIEVDASVADLLASCELAVAKARELTERARTIVAAKPLSAGSAAG